MSAVTVLCELQKGQLKDISNFGFCFLGGGLEDFRLPIRRGAETSRFGDIRKAAALSKSVKFSAFVCGC